MSFAAIAIERRPTLEPPRLPLVAGSAPAPGKPFQGGGLAVIHVERAPERCPSKLVFRDPCGGAVYKTTSCCVP